MSDSKVFMFPENGYNNNGLGLGGWGGGILGFILGILLGNNGFFGNGFGGYGGGYGLANQLNNDNNADLILNAINGTDADVRLLATTLNSDLNETKAAINAVQGAIAQVGKGTGNSELQLDRMLANKRIFPAVNLVLSSTRRDELLQDQTTLNRMWIIRKFIAEMNPIEAMSTIRDRLVQTHSNEEFLLSMNG